MLSCDKIERAIKLCKAMNESNDTFNCIYSVYALIKEKW